MNFDFCSQRPLLTTLKNDSHLSSNSVNGWKQREKAKRFNTTYVDEQSSGAGKASSAYFPKNHGMGLRNESQIPTQRRANTMHDIVLRLGSVAPISPEPELECCDAPDLTSALDFEQAHEEQAQVRATTRARGQAREGAIQSRMHAPDRKLNRGFSTPFLSEHSQH